LKRVLIAPSTFGEFSKEPVDSLLSTGYNLTYNQKGRKLNDKELLELISECDGVVAGTEKYTREVLDSACKLKVISRLGVGMDNIDQAIAVEKGIKVFKTETSPAPAVAELTLGLILNLLRRISLNSSNMKKGIWQKVQGSLLSGKTLGIIGLGSIGKHLVDITRGFGLIYLAHDLRRDKVFTESKDIQYCSMDDLFSNSDIVSIHVNLSEDTRGLIDYQALECMKREVILINTSRGEVINEHDLIRALDKQMIAGAGLDVFSDEPYKGPLLQYDNVVFTPHIGAYTREIRMKMELEAVQNLIEGLENE